jgi:hypothetical protein
MQSSRAFQYLPFLLSVIFWPGMTPALSPDPRILSLIPHDAQIVDGTGKPPQKSARRSFLVFKRESAIDLRDFQGLVGMDDSKFIRQIFLIAGTQMSDARVQHSLIAVGRFNQSRIYNAAIQNHARVREYRGIEIIELDPFSREAGTFDDVRWLAVIESDLALFGTIAGVREELDRHLDHTPADSFLLERFGRLGSDDETWCLFAHTVQKEAVRQAFASLDPRLADVVRDQSDFQFGIHYGRRIRFDYASAEIANSNDPAIERRRTGSERPTDARMQSFTTTEKTPLDSHPVIGRLSVARTGYENWLNRLLNSKSVAGNSTVADEAR